MKMIWFRFEKKTLLNMATTYGLKQKMQKKRGNVLK